MIAKDDTFTELCLLAARENWCWKLVCTTCAHMHFRFGLYELNIGRRPGTPDWVTSQANRRLSTDLKMGWREVTPLIEESQQLHRILARASINTIASKCQFPDWLGYLGIGLYYTSMTERQNLFLSSRWGKQLLEMVETNSQAGVMLSERLGGASPLVWSDLELIEDEIIKGTWLDMVRAGS